jgi:cytochrome c oxidase subunit III
MPELRPEPQFADFAQQGEAAQLGMFVFIATEVLFFGGLIFTYYVYRQLYPEGFAAAGRDAKIVLGAINAAILLTSSLTMVLAIDAAAEGRRRAIVSWLVATAALGAGFLGVKGYEYLTDYRDHVVPALNFLAKPGYGGPGELFWIFYFIATGIHALHLTIGIGAVLAMVPRARRGAFTPAYYGPLEVVGLYWSFVDTVWLFLFPALYLMGRG